MKKIILVFLTAISSQLKSCCKVTLPKDQTRLNEDLWYAVQDGDMQAIIDLFNQISKPNVNAPHPAYGTPLIYAAYTRPEIYARDKQPCSKKFLELLIARGSNVNAQDNRGMTALMSAVRDTQKVTLLVACGADTSLTTLEGETVFTIGENLWLPYNMREECRNKEKTAEEIESEEQFKKALLEAIEKGQKICSERAHALDEKIQETNILIPDLSKIAVEYAFDPRAFIPCEAEEKMSAEQTQMTKQSKSCVVM